MYLWDYPNGDEFVQSVRINRTDSHSIRASGVTVHPANSPSEDGKSWRQWADSK